MQINGTAFTIIGVAPPQFTGLDPYLKSAMFLPAMMIPRLSPNSVGPYDMLLNRDYRSFAVKGRVKNGVTLAQAQGELAGIAQGLAEACPATNKDRLLTIQTELQRRAENFPAESGLMAMLMLMATLVLVASCFNVANLLLSRARSRVREIAVRLALGAGRMRMIRQLLKKVCCWRPLGAIAGLWLAWASLAYVRTLKVPADLPFMSNFYLDHRALWFTLAAALASVPALQASRVDLTPALKASGGGDPGRRRLWGRNLLVVGQVSISLVLLLVAAMRYRGLSRSAPGRGRLSNQPSAGHACRSRSLVLAMAGLYGLVSYSVSRRTREFAIRMAIGADRASVLWMVLQQAMVLSALGLLIGSAASRPARDLLKSLVAGVDTDWIPYVVVPLLLLAVTVLASYAPARRASRIDPMKALREE